MASWDGNNISHHFGRSRFFLVLEVRGGGILNRSLRENVFRPHIRGQCKEGDDHRRAGQRHHAYVCCGPPGVPSGDLPRDGAACSGGAEPQRDLNHRCSRQIVARGAPKATLVGNVVRRRRFLPRPLSLGEAVVTSSFSRRSMTVCHLTPVFQKTTCAERIGVPRGSGFADPAG